MSKIICDVCGTAYPETAAQCPICGCAKGNDARTVDGNKVETEGQEASSYQFVKGGRFSKKNVRKRNKEMQARQEPPVDDAEEDSRSNTGLIITLLVILAAVVAVVIYIVITFFGSGAGGQGNNPGLDPNPSTSDSTTMPQDTTGGSEDTTAPIVGDIPCTSLALRDPSFVLDDIGSTAKIGVNVSPVDCTEAVSFVSNNEAVATVDENGVVTAVGEGSAEITVSCGIFSVVCHVQVDFATEPPTEPSTEPSTEPTSEPQEEFELNRSDITFDAAGKSWKLYSGSIPLNKIQWSSDNEAVATIKNGEVTAVAPGTTTVYGEYNGVKVGCVIRCRWEGTPASDPTDPEPSEGGTYTISHTDVSINVGESFTLKLKDADGKTVSVTWSASSNGKVNIDGNTITGAASGTVKVSATVNGTTYTCIVRVR